jgi:hypothetical protein
MERTQLNPEQGVEHLESYRLQKERDQRKRELDAMPERTELQELERLLAEVGTWCETVLFSIPEAGPGIETIKSDIPELAVIAQVGSSFAVSIPANDESLGKFTRVYGNLPDPSPEDLSVLEKELGEKLSTWTNDRRLDKFVQLYDKLPDPAPEGAVDPGAVS